MNIIPQIKDSRQRAKYFHTRMKQIAKTDFAGGILFEPFGWMAAWSVALWPGKDHNESG
jgi:hypothetical protein